MLSSLVAQRVREIGVRMAMGATPYQILGMVEKQAAVWAAYGTAVGLAASAGLARLARGLLFQVSPSDPLSLASAVALLAVVSAAAAWWPAHRASTVDPAISLRQE
jgi:ABC-type antimicrobial peptide transport system permease subunit